MPKLMHRLTMAAAIIAVALAIFGLVFRATFYWMIPVPPAEPAGLGDLIELLIFYGVFAAAFVAMLLAVMLLLVPQWRQFRFAISALVVSLVTPPMYFILHGLMPRLIH